MTRPLRGRSGRGTRRSSDNGKAGLQATDAFRASGKWDGKWEYLLPLGVPMAFAKAIEIMDFPPLTLITNQDYLKSKTTSRW